MNLKDKKIAIIGLGYVGLPLAVEFAAKYDVLGFDVNPKRIQELENHKDHTLEISSEQLANAKKLTFTTDSSLLKNCNIFIVTVPTPIDQYNNPDITLLKKASSVVGKVLKKGDIVIYESTVYPGCTEEDCVPVLEATSGLGFNQDFFCGYSPERINPGDKEHTVTKILKITSGSTPEIATEINQLYSSIITAGTHQASSIKVAEAAKVIENAQRDINIAFVNELSLIFNRLGIDTHEVLEAAGTKWNFLKFKPGLVGGHCIGVDPYYLAQKAKEVDYNPEILLAGRRINDGMSDFIAGEVIKGLIDADVKIKGSKVLVLGVTFKENCPDVRNTKVVDIIFKLKRFGLDVTVVDPSANISHVEEEYQIHLNKITEITDVKFDAIIHAVAHEEFKSFDFSSHSNSQTFIYDVKGSLPKNIISKRL
ncbi:MAG TPA: nucleotide sugar dehydrogenase [Pelobium sp.]|nr:nucleotide sugar dehydrogenase [Pelobium sp.]